VVVVVVVLHLAVEVTCETRKFATVQLTYRLGEDVYPRCIALRRTVAAGTNHTQGRRPIFFPSIIWCFRLFRAVQVTAEM